MNVGVKMSLLNLLYNKGQHLNLLADKDVGGKFINITACD
jgi:hypothetical protein